MTHWRDATEQLQRLFDYHRFGIITDFDGTLSPIVPVPDDAAPTKRNRELLQQLHERLALVAVVSGRAAADVRERVGLPELVYAGNHGLERWRGDGVEVVPAVEPYLDKLQAAKKDVQAEAPEGMWVEDKKATLSVHYRETDDPQATRDAYIETMQQIAGAHDLKLFEGRMIFELRPPLDMDKGTIFEQLIDEYKLQSAIYIGDDVTDADALRKAQTLRNANNHIYALAIGVQSEDDDTPAAVLDSSDLLVSGVSDVESFLEWLLNASSASSS